MSYTNSALAASRDSDLRDRMSIVAAKLNIPNPEAWVEINAKKLALTEVGLNVADTVASIYEYAISQYVVPVPPGKDASYVTDAFLEYAVKKVAGLEEPTE